MKKKGLTLFELALSIIIITVFTATFLTFIYKAAIHAKEITLQGQLSNLRLSLDLYRALKNVEPADLKVLMQAQMDKGPDKVNFENQFLSMVRKDAQGYPVDSFGNRFYYNAQKEMIRSQTEGYENW